MDLGGVSVHADGNPVLVPWCLVGSAVPSVVSPEGGVAGGPHSRCKEARRQTDAVFCSLEVAFSTQNYYNVGVILESCAKS